ncbi:MAG: hypothetical protein AAB351_03520 [Patescibacteria group bacterium]
MRLSDIQEYFLNLSSADNFEAIKLQADGVIQAGDPADAEDFLNLLSKSLAAQGNTVQSTNPQMYDQYEAMWTLLAFKAFPTLNSDDQENLLKTRFFFAIQNGYNPDAIVNEFFLDYQDDSVVKNKFGIFVKYLLSNAERLGSNTVEIEGKKYLPELRYWIQDYSKFPSKTPKRGSVERLAYINQSGNVRSLTQVYRQALLRVLKFYDDLVNVDRPKKMIDEEDLEDAREDMEVLAQAWQEAQGGNVVSMPQAPNQQVGLNIDQKLQDLRNRVGR